MLLSGYNLFGGAVNEVYLRVRSLRRLAGDTILGSPLVGMTHGVVMLVFVTLIVGYLTASVVSRARRDRPHRAVHEDRRSEERGAERELCVRGDG